ncbi:MAG: hypothetical protein IID33_15035, partial [Planctomycetes bacterium]|nr:hypothetical protein [Planctomycetota bacterium]
MFEHTQGKDAQPPDLTPSLIQSLREGDRTAGALLEDLYRTALIRFWWG